MSSCLIIHDDVRGKSKSLTLSAYQQFVILDSPDEEVRSQGKRKALKFEAVIFIINYLMYNLFFSYHNNRTSFHLQS